MSKNLIVKHNKVIESKYNMTSTEAKLVAKLTSMIEKDDEEFKDYIFQASDLLEELGLGENYTLLKKAIKKLITREIEIEEKKENIITTVLSSCRYNKETSTIYLRYDPVLKPYFLQLKRDFTKYYIENVLELNSFYSIRIYELLKQYEKLKERIIEIKDLKEILGIKDKYNRYNDFKRRVIKTAVEEINDKTDLNVEFEEIKTGRKVTAIKFLIEKKTEFEKMLANGGRLRNQADKCLGYIPEDPDMLHKFEDLYNILPGNEQIDTNKKTLFNLLKRYEFENIEADIKYAKEFNPDNFMGFLVDSCENGHFGKTILEKEEKKKELSRKKKEEEKKKKEAKKETQKAIEEMVATKCAKLTKEEKEKFKQRYNYLRKIDPSEIDFEDRIDMMFAKSHNFEEFVKKKIKSKIL